MERLENPVQRYAWGSLTAIPSLLGKPPDGGPQAELWLGAHPSAPSTIRDGTTLEALIAQSPQRLLGDASFARFGARLPFLLKVLAAAQPLSLQAHPSLAQAQAGFALEEAAGLPRGAPNRNYRDANHKPEILCALSNFHALCGFRRVADSARLFRGLGLDTSLLEGAGLRAYFEHVMTLPKEAMGALVDQLVDAARTPVPGFEAECQLALRLAALYPRDVGIVGALLLNLVTLAPGEALYLAAGNLHAYLEGTGVELMANSDNVLRGGLTPKHVDVPELLSVLDFVDGPPRVLRPGPDAEAVYPSPAPDFRLSRITLSGRPVTLPARGAQVLLVVEGEVTAKGELLRRGSSVFIGADEGAIALSGRGTVFRATTGESMKLAHYSDIHVTHFPLRGPFALKRLAAVASYTLAGRGKHFEGSDERIARLLEDVDAQGVDHSLCTGDLTGVSTEAEFSRVAELFGPRLQQPARFTVIPGNHDRYVRGTEGLFDRHFAAVSEGGQFPFLKHLTHEVSVVAIDVARPTSLIDSSGLCGAKQRDALLALLTDASLKGRFVVLAMHYGLLRSEGQRDARHHGLRDDLEVMELIDRDDVSLDLVLHGHMHRPYVVKTKRRTIINAGSATDLHVKQGCGYHVYDIDPAARRVRISRRTWNAGPARYEAAPGSPLNVELTTR